MFASAAGPTRPTCTGLVIQPPEGTAKVQAITASPVIEQGPGISRDFWPDITPRPYSLPSTSTLTLTGPGVVYITQDGYGTSCVVYGGLSDFNCDGDLGTDMDISAFFACLTDGCGGGMDFDGDGDPGTDLDVGAFFVALAGGAC